MATKPRVLTPIEVTGGMSFWFEQYACWLSEQKSYQNMTERARFGRIKAMRSLSAKLDKMLPFMSEIERQRIAYDINQTAKLKAGKANARAIALVPQLLSENIALRNTLAAIVKQFDADPDGGIGAGVINDARAALANDKE